MGRATVLTVIAAAVALFPATVVAHSWINNLVCDCTSATGYPRNFQGRQAHGTQFDRVMTHKMEGRKPDAPVCSVEQQINVQNPKFPRLSCPAGSRVTFTYNPNGHVTVDANANPKTWSIHWNKYESIDTRSQLMRGQTKELFNNVSSRIPFDDGTCGQSKGRSKDTCSGNFILPADADPKSYKFVWFWTFDSDANGGGEEYSTCFDINVTAADPSCAAESKGTETEPATTAVQTQAQEPTVMKQTVKSTTPAGETKKLQKGADLPDTTCVEKVSDGDKNVGITAVFDEACPTKVGCFGEKCRFCKLEETPQSKHLDECN